MQRIIHAGTGENYFCKHPIKGSLTRQREAAKNKTMKLYIDPNMTVNDVQKSFKEEFPYIKLEFFNKKAFSNNDYSAKNIVIGKTKIADIQAKAKAGEIEIGREMKVNELEDILKKQFNMAAQVFRKSGNLWLETTMTDHWTLDQQSAHAKEISAPYKSDLNTKDYDLNRDADR
jgi:hypothetical protein